MDVAAKPLEANPFLLSQPLGAALAFSGVRNCMPLLHGVQGCAGFAKELFSRHFNKPVMIHTSAVNDITAVLDGGEYGIGNAIENVAQKALPELVGLFSTGLTETKGDDIRGAAKKILLPSVWVNTPDFEGSFESGWALAVEAIVTQLCEECASVTPKKAVILPHASITPAEVEKIKEFLTECGFLEVLAIPDLSTSIDGMEGKASKQMSGGGIAIESIKTAADCEVAVAVGDSMKGALRALLKKNGQINAVAIPSLSGIRAGDRLVDFLVELGYTPGEKIKQWRKRATNMLLDTHALIAGQRFVLGVEADQRRAITDLLEECGATVINEDEAVIRDFDDIAGHIGDVDVLIANERARALAKAHGKIVIARGYPALKSYGAALKNDLLYEGCCRFLAECADAIAMR